MNKKDGESLETKRILVLKSGPLDSELAKTSNQSN
jgi:hypothetical protein